MDLNKERTTPKMVTPRCLKYLFLVLNGLYLQISLFLLLIGSWIADDAKSFIKITGFGLKYVQNETIKSDEHVLDYIARLTDETELREGLLIIGFSILVISFLGWIGVHSDYAYFLTAYSLLIILLVTVQVGVIGIIMAEKSKGTLLPTSFKDILNESIHDHYIVTNQIFEERDTNSMTILWDITMETAHCCGVENYQDFRNAKNAENFNDSDTIIPNACCKVNEAKRKSAPSLNLATKLPPAENPISHFGGGGQ